MPVSLPPPASSKTPLIATQSKPLKGGEGELETTLVVLPCPPGSSRRIPYQIHLRTSGSGAPLAIDGANDSLKVSLELCKHTWTKGIKTSLGSPNGHDFPGIMEGSLKLDDQRPGPSRGTMHMRQEARGGEKGDGGLLVEGEYEVEDGLVTALGCGIRLSVSRVTMSTRPIIK